MHASLKWWLPLLSGLLFWASFHPLNAGCLGYVALVPLLIFSQVASGPRAFFCAWGGGYVAFVLGYSWFAYTVPPGPFLVAVYMGLWFPAFTWAVRRVGLQWSPVLWVATEALRSTLFGGLPWLLIGYTQHESLEVIQIADLGGVWLVSLLVAFVNAAFVCPGRGIRIAAGLALVLAAAYGRFRLPTIDLVEGPKIAVVQPNIPQSLKKEAIRSQAQAIDNYKKHFALTLQAAEQHPDLIVWPEAAIYKGLYVNVDKAPEWHENAWFGALLEPAEKTGIETLIGALVTEERTGEESDQYTNSALRIVPGKGVAGRYDKTHLVPFAERYWIFKGIVHAISGLSLAEMKPGDGYPVWDLGKEKYGAQICYEAIFPEISRQIARNGASFTVNISNDGWFKSSGELDQMLAMARFRSIENRMHVVRATNTGISAFIEPTGRLQSVLEVDGKVKEVEGVLVGRIRLTRSSSLYRAAGDWVKWGCLLGALGALAGRIFVDRKKRAA
ncbi:MAG TPA: apolipoprotein N-acyltransferase [Planctomycetota bacterium]|nr:apolipoprotein N-acyltransferase [Planctomycetota bacterium]